MTASNKFIKDRRFHVWIVEAKMNDGKWFPMPQWGAGQRQRDALRSCVIHCIGHGIRWAVDIVHDRHSRRIRSRRLQ